MFYEKLKTICDKKGVKVTPLVLECGGTKGMLSGWKKGASPSIEIVAKIAVRLNISTDLLVLENDLEHAEISSSSPKFVNNATYNGTVNSITGDYAHQENTIEIRKSDSADVNVSDAALEYDKILNSLNDSDREMLISQVRAIAGTFKKK